MRILVAPDKFKGSLTAQAAADAITAGIRDASSDVEIDLCPLADGGEGTVSALVAATGGELLKRRVTGPLTDIEVDAAFGLLPGGIAVIEMAAASGLALVTPQQRDPFRTTTYGTGELLVEAARLGVKKIVLGIGGSATVDGGIGCAQACGFPVILQDEGPADMRQPLTGEDLKRVVQIKHASHSPIAQVQIEVASDVSNPLYGPNGAARIYGPQKGATPQQVEQLDQWLESLAIKTQTTRIAQTPGAGAAGGLGFAMMAFFAATLRPGFEIVAEAVNLRKRIAHADLCITGEGRLDESSLNGKAPLALAKLCREIGVPCVALVGSVADGLDLAGLLTAVHSLSGKAGEATAMAQAAELLRTTASTLASHLPPV